MEEALENELVLSKIFSYCNVKDLRTIRVISKRWLQESLPIWRKKTIVKIRIDSHGGGGGGEGIIELPSLKRIEREGEYYKNVGDWEDVHRVPWEEVDAPRNVVTLDEFLDFVERNSLAGRSGTAAETAPFQNFKIEFNKRPSLLSREKVDPVATAADVHILTPRFWQLCGAQMKHLEVRNYQQRHCGSLRDILLGPVTPLLETVVLKSRNVYRKEGRGKAKHTGVGVPPVTLCHHGPKSTVKSFKYVWAGIETPRFYGDETEGFAGVIDNERTQLPFTWQEMFTCFYNLEKLSISLDLHNTLMQETVLAPLQALQLFKNQGGLGTLEHLSYRRGNNKPGTQAAITQVLKLLGETKIVLRSLALGWGLRNDKRVPVPELEYYQLLERQKDNLESLDVEKLATPPAPGQGIFPVGVIFPNLNTLVIDRAQFDEEGMMNMFQVAPSLKTVRVLGENIKRPLPPSFQVNDFICFDKAIQEELESDDKLPTLPVPVCENMKELVCQKVCTLKMLLQLTELMPNLEVLELPMDNSALQLVCQKWTKLRRLTALLHPLGKITDAGIIGCWDSPWPSSGIKHLKDLRYFSFKWANARRHQYEGTYLSTHFLTFVSLTQGIFRLSRLRYLKINAQLSKQQREELFRHVPSCVLQYEIAATRKGSRTVTNIWHE